MPRAAFVAYLLLTALLACTSHKPPVAPIDTVASPTNGYLLLADGSIHPDGDGPASGFHVRGRVSTTGKPKVYKFEPVGDVQGEGELASGGTMGWFEIGSGKFHHMQEAVSPQRPYINGAKGEDGIFRPSSKNVVY